jgi:hypothetical protein
MRPSTRREWWLVGMVDSHYDLTSLTDLLVAGCGLLVHKLIVVVHTEHRWLTFRPAVGLRGEGSG